MEFVLDYNNKIRLLIVSNISLVRDIAPDKQRVLKLLEEDIFNGNK